MLKSLKVKAMYSQTDVALHHEKLGLFMFLIPIQLSIIRHTHGTHSDDTFIQEVTSHFFSAV